MFPEREPSLAFDIVYAITRVSLRLHTICDGRATFLNNAIVLVISYITRTLDYHERLSTHEEFMNNQELFTIKPVVALCTSGKSS